MPHNLPSIGALEKAGFHKEGIARKNVKINKKWQDHQVLAILNSADSIFHKKKPSVPGFFFTAQLQALFLSALVRNRVLNHLHFRLPH